MKDKIKLCFLLLMNTIQAGRIYSTNHPKFDEFLDRLYANLQEILEHRKELTLGLVSGELAWEDEIFFDLSGYPKLPYNRKPHLASQMVAICDVYDALAIKRSYKKDYPPDKIYELMMMEKGKAFAPELLDKFYQFIGLWPVGAIVVLNDNRVGVVRRVNEHDIARPVVEIIAPQNEGELIDLSQNRELTIVQALNPRGKGKKYLALVTPSSTAF